MKTCEDCRVCGVALRPDLPGMTICLGCAQRELAAIRRYFIRSPILGLAPAGIALAVILYLRGRYMPHIGYVIAPGFVGAPSELVASLAALSDGRLAQLCAALFAVPFGLFLHIDYQGLGFVALAILLLELLFSFVTGPIYAVYRLYRRQRLRAYLAAVEADQP